MQIFKTYPPQIALCRKAVIGLLDRSYARMYADIKCLPRPISAADIQRVMLSYQREQELLIGEVLYMDRFASTNAIMTVEEAANYQPAY
jgi:hypothetical protein